MTRYAYQHRTSTNLLELGIHPDEDQHLVLRVTNNTASTIFIDWAETHLRWPNGFESPVSVVPSGHLGSIYAGGMVEYQLKPEHYYLSPDTQWKRRSSLSGSLFPSALYEKYRGNYRLTLLVPMGTSEAACCGASGIADGPCAKTCTVHEVSANFVRTGRGVAAREMSQ